MLQEGLEPLTLDLLDPCSTKLSYSEPRCEYYHFFSIRKKSKKTHKGLVFWINNDLQTKHTGFMVTGT